MKVGLVLERFDPEHGGLEHWTWQFAQQLLKRGIDVHVIAFEFHPSVTQGGIVVHKLAMPRSRLNRAQTIERHLRTLDLDVIHDMGCGWYADIFHPHGGSTLALWEHNLHRIPKWRQIRFWRERRYREMAEIERRQHACDGSIVVTVSRMVQHHFEILHPLPAQRTRLIYNGVDVERFSPAHRSLHRSAMQQQLGTKNEVVFLMLAHNLLLKNAPALLKAAARLADRGHSMRALVAGGKKSEPFIRLAKRLGISRHVTFHDHLDDPMPLYAAADVFVHPTWYDPCSLVTLEALACGLPVITTKLNGAAELMTDGKEGYVLHAADDIGTLSARMESLMDLRLREQMGAAGRSLALGHSFEQQTGQFLELYEEVCHKKQFNK